MTKTASLLIGLLFGFNAFAQSHSATEAELQWLYNHPKYSESRYYIMDNPNWKPAMDVAKFQYVLFSGRATNNEAQFLKNEIVKNLPKGMKAVILIEQGTLASYQSKYASLVNSERIIFASSANAANGTWARDAFPVPVVDVNGVTSLIGAQYFRNFDGNNPIAKSIQFNLKQYSFVFVGGNILADEKGACFIVDSSRRFNTTENDYYAAYGCKKVHLMDFVSGIGDIDEVLKPVGNNTILTNTPEYVDQLKSLGYNVVELPSAKSPSYPNRTYNNSLILNGTAFVPMYGLSTDDEAAAVYEGLGYKVVRIPSKDMSDNFAGSVHCQTMAYPAMNQADLMSVLQLQPF